VESRESSLEWRIRCTPCLFDSLLMFHLFFHNVLSIFLRPLEHCYLDVGSTSRKAAEGGRGVE
jgi:hypothetical protein